MARMGRPPIHGHSGKPEYDIWIGIIARCHNPKAALYSRYGARGIEVAQRWRESFEAFLEDMGPRPEGRYGDGRGVSRWSIERVDNERGYEPGNCIWATRTTQQRNRSNTVFLEHDGRRQSLPDWADEIGLSYEALKTRLRNGWSVERAITTPPRRRFT